MKNDKDTLIGELMKYFNPPFLGGFLYSYPLFSRMSSCSRQNALLFLNR